MTFPQDQKCRTKKLHYLKEIADCMRLVYNHQPFTHNTYILNH
jgi:hypothetical protein